MIVELKRKQFFLFHFHLLLHKMFHYSLKVSLRCCYVSASIRASVRCCCCCYYCCRCRRCCCYYYRILSVCNGIFMFLSVRQHQMHALCIDPSVYVYTIFIYGLLSVFLLKNQKLFSVSLGACASHSICFLCYRMCSRCCAPHT